MRPYGAQSYVQTNAQSASPVQLVVMLYDGAVQAAMTAHDAMLRKDIPRRRTALNKLLAIIAELQNTLDLERGGKVARDLDGIYSYLFTILLDAVAKQDARPIDEARRMLETLRDAWQQIAAQPPVPAEAGGRP